MDRRWHSWVGRGLLLGAVLLSPAAARAAHEWRAAWGAPYPLEVAEQTAAVEGDSLRAAVGTAQPFAVPGLRFHRVLLRWPTRQWSLHSGTLRASGYSEWHLGVARRVAPSPWMRILIGGRIFGVHTDRLQAAGTLIAHLHPPRTPWLRLEAGIVDASPVREPAAQPVILARGRLLSSRGCVVAERMVCPGVGADTVVIVRYMPGTVGWLLGYRWATGESSTTLLLRCGPVQLAVGQRWHPALGWTRQIGLAWLRAGGSEGGG